jgi:plastocyanin
MNTSRRFVLKSALVSAVSALIAPLSAGSSTAGKNYLVVIAGAAFEPKSLVVRSGDSVTWINNDIVPHTATADDGSWDTGLLNSGEEKSIVFSDAQSSAYICTYHPSMQASLQVE